MLAQISFDPIFPFPAQTSTTMNSIQTLATLIHIVLAAPADQCPLNCLCTDPEGNQIGIKWLTCNDFPQQIPSNATHLTINSRPLKALTGRHLEPFAGLKYLGLAGLHIEQIDDGAFEKFEKLQELKLTSNRLTHIGEATFRNCSDLEGLSLGSNRIRTLAANAFRRLDRLQRLDLSHNFLAVLPDVLPASLVELDASDNLVARLPHVRVLLARLTKLDLCANRFERFEADNFVAPRLGRVCLGDRVRHVNASAFDWGAANAMRALEISSAELSVDSLVDALRQMTALDSLSLERVTVPAGTRADFRLEELRTLRLKDVRLLGDDFFIFDAIAHVQTLCLEGSPKIAEFLLSRDENLRKFGTTVNLKLHDANVSRLSRRQFDFFTNVRTLSLAGNPLVCDCALEWLVQRVQNNSLLVSEPERIQCDSPEKWRGLRVFSDDVSANLCRTRTDVDGGGSGAAVSIYHVVYALIALTGLLIIAFLVVVILLCKARCGRKARENRVVYRSRYSLDHVPPSDQTFPVQIPTSNDEIKDDSRPCSTLTFHPRRGR